LLGGKHHSPVGFLGGQIFDGVVSCIIDEYRLARF
jgi:hypothetical protein